MPTGASVAVFESRDVFDADTYPIGEFLLRESCVATEPTERQAKHAMVLGVVGLVFGHCKSGGGPLCSADHISAPALLEQPGAWRRRPSFDAWATIPVRSSRLPRRDTPFLGASLPGGIEDDRVDCARWTGSAGS